jgi:hypothetical protein
MPFTLTLDDGWNLIFVFCIYCDLADFLSLRRNEVSRTIEARLN